MSTLVQQLRQAEKDRARTSDPMVKWAIDWKITMVKLANAGDAELKRSEREITRLQKRLDGFKQG